MVRRRAPQWWASLGSHLKYDCDLLLLLLLYECFECCVSNEEVNCGCEEQSILRVRFEVTHLLPARLGFVSANVLLQLLKHATCQCDNTAISLLHCALIRDY